MIVHVDSAAFIPAFRKGECSHRKVKDVELYVCETAVDGVTIRSLIHSSDWKRWSTQWRGWEK